MCLCHVDINELINCSKFDLNVAFSGVHNKYTVTRFNVTLEHNTDADADIVVTY